jgi:hypothetical protein
LNKKEHLYAAAERLYVYENLTVEETASILKIAPRTVGNWKSKQNWGLKRKAYTETRLAFHQELFEFARKLMKEISSDMETGEKVDRNRLSALCHILPMFGKVKEYEDGLINSKINKKKTVSPETIRYIEEEILGIKRNVGR